MGRAPCCDKAKVKKGPWSPEEDAKLRDYMHSHGNCGNWIALPHKAGLKRCGKSCRLRWLNYLRPNIKHGEFSDDEDRLILTLFSTIGSRWSIIAAQLPGRTDNDIKNYWNTKLKKKLMGMSSMATYNNNPQRIKPINTGSYHQSPVLLSSSSTTVSNYNNTLSFTGFDQSTLLSNPPPNGLISSAAPAPTILHQQSSYLVFGGAPEPSCSSINGSSSVEDDDHHQKNINNSDPLIWEEAAPLVDYGLEEIKQLISSTNNTGNYFDDTNITGERAMMYY